MSGADVPYQLRPNKHVERQLFVDLLGQIHSARPLSQYVYSSMAGKFLEDHKALGDNYRLRAAFSFESNGTVVKRQEFNRPFETIECRHQGSEEFVAGFSEMSSEFGDDTNFVTWLDFTDPSKRLSQLQQFSSLISHSREFDIAKITINANIHTITGEGAKKPEQFESIAEWRLQILRSQLGYYLDGPKEDQMRQAQFPMVLAKAIGSAAKKGIEAKGGLVVRPLSSFSYSDGHHPMISVTCIVLEESQANNFFDTAEISAWPHLCGDWGDVEMIDVPDLSMRERLHIDRVLFSESTASIIGGLKFQFDEDPAISEAKIEQYRRHYKYYPQFARFTH